MPVEVVLVVVAFTVVVTLAWVIVVLATVYVTI